MKKAFLNLFTAEGRRHEVPTSKNTEIKNFGFILQLRYSSMDATKLF